MGQDIQYEQSTVCSESSDPFDIVSYYSILGILYKEESSVIFIYLNLRILATLTRARGAQTKSRSS